MKKKKEIKEENKKEVEEDLETGMYEEDTLAWEDEEETPNEGKDFEDF